MDRVSKGARSRIMSAIRGKDTGLEIKVRKALRASGIGYRLHIGGLPGKPDIVMMGRKLAVFVNGCFWHRHSVCRPSMPRTNVAFWREKFRRNVDRDRKAIRGLEDMGWRVAVVWECSVADGIAEVIRMAREGT